MESKIEFNLLYSNRCFNLFSKLTLYIYFTDNLAIRFIWTPISFSDTDAEESLEANVLAMTMV